jgi:hypothetical protein
MKVLKNELEKLIKEETEKYLQEQGDDELLLHDPHEDTDQIGARELELYIQNDGDLYRQQYQPIQKNLVTKIARGIYDPEKAVKLFMYLVDNGAKKYAMEFGSGGVAGPSVGGFDKATRLEVARSLTKEFEQDAKNGEFDQYLPKKYQKKAELEEVENEKSEVDLANEELFSLVKNKLPEDVMQKFVKVPFQSKIALMVRHNVPRNIILKALAIWDQAHLTENKKLNEDETNMDELNKFAELAEADDIKGAKVLYGMVAERKIDFKTFYEALKTYKKENPTHETDVSLDDEEGKQLEEFQSYGPQKLEDIVDYLESFSRDLDNKGLKQEAYHADMILRNLTSAISELEHGTQHSGHMAEEQIDEKAVSQNQQKAAAIAYAASKGEIPKSKLKGASKEMAKMPSKELKKFASTKTSDLPKRVKKEEKK